MNSRVIVSVVLIAVLFAMAAVGAVVLVKLRQPPPTQQPTPVIQEVVAPPLKAAADYVIQVTGYGSVLFATVLTLLAAPSLCLIGNDIRRGLRWLLTGQWPTREQVACRNQETA